MKGRPLGRSGFEVAPLAFGANVFGWTVDEATAFRLLDAFTDHGFNLVDTADIYSKWAPGNSGGESETVIGRWIALGGGRREKIVLATKVGMEMPGGRKGLARNYIAQAAEDSLRRLQTDRIDLYQAHTEDAGTPIDETLEAFSRLIRDGKVRAIGASNYSAESMLAAEEAASRSGARRYDTLQPQYNLYARQEFEEKLAPTCARLGVGVIAFWALASGFLTGKYRSEADLAQSPRGAGMKKYMNDRGMRILDALHQVAKDNHAKSSQVALAWLMSRPTVTAPIASATTVAQLRELMAAATLSLDAESLALLDDASAY
ncbi:MAG TPA: aldo/keto reductase [Usitatibacter sp.]|nr:aldo/keto reductase [Usitatibacter sp.]